MVPGYAQSDIKTRPSGLLHWHASPWYILLTLLCCASALYFGIILVLFLRSMIQLWFSSTPTLDLYICTWAG